MFMFWQRSAFNDVNYWVHSISSSLALTFRHLFWKHFSALQNGQFLDKIVQFQNRKKYSRKKIIFYFEVSKYLTENSKVWIALFRNKIYSLCNLSTYILLYFLPTRGKTFQGKLSTASKKFIHTHSTSTVSQSQVHLMCQNHGSV